jgi:hypothetical protein
MEQPKCHEKDISYPVNDALTCWWLTLNICFFHKRRAEFEEFFNTAPTEQSVELSKYNSYYAKIEESIEDIDTPATKEADKIKNRSIYQIFKCVYYYYTNQHDKLKEVIEAMNATFGRSDKVPVTDEEKQDFMIQLRLRPEMGAFFNKKDIDPKTRVQKPGFSVDKATIQDADEYIVSLINMFGLFKNILLKSSRRGKYEKYDIFNITQILNLYDIQVWTELETGVPSDPFTNTKGKEHIPILKRYITTNTNTLIVKFNPYKSEKREKSQKAPIEIQDIIELPLVNIQNAEIRKDSEDSDGNHPELIGDINTLIEVYRFELDAILCFTGGAHYYGYVKCSGADKWLRYGAMTKGKLENELDFEEVKNSKNIKEETLMLFYTKAEQVKEEFPVKEEDKEETKDEEEKKEEKKEEGQEEQEAAAAPEAKETPATGATEGEAKEEKEATAPAEKLDIPILQKTITTFINNMPKIAKPNKDIYKLLQKIIYSTKIEDFDGIIKISNLKLNAIQLDYMKRLHKTIILMDKTEKEYIDKNSEYIKSIHEIYTEIDNAIMQKISN